MNTLDITLTTNELVSSVGLKHIAIIMDGNRRWAKEKNLPSAMGHKKGVDSLKSILKACNEFGIKYLAVYAFSTENWNRKPEEVNFLMDLLAATLTKELKELHENNVVINFIGDLTQLSKSLQNVLSNAVEKTKENNGVNLQIAINYGAKDEIKNAVIEIANEVKEGKLNPEEITEDTIANRLYTRGVKDPDLLIRTGGEMRISNYLLWQIAYSEIYVTEQYWPDFDKTSLQKAINEFANRQRRYGV